MNQMSPDVGLGKGQGTVQREKQTRGNHRASEDLICQNANRVLKALVLEAVIALMTPAAQAQDLLNSFLH